MLLSSVAFALVAELVDLAAACRLDFATSLVAESVSESVCLPSVWGECALGTDVLKDRQEEFECFAAASPHLVSMLLAPGGDPDAPDIPTPRSYAEAIEGPYSSQWRAAMDAEMSSWKSTGTYVDEVPPPGANIVTDLGGFESVGAASAPSGRRRTGKGKGGKGTGGTSWGGGGGGGGSGGGGGGSGSGGGGGGVAIFDLDYDAILAAMYAMSYSAEGDCYVCVPPDPGIEAAALGTGEAAALGASASAAPGASESAFSRTSSAQAFHTFTLDSGASRSFFRDHTTLTPLSQPVAVSLADPSGGPVLASFSTVLPCPAAPSGTLSGLYLPSFSTNLVSGADLQDKGVDQFTPAGQRVTHCTCARTGRHLATFTRRLGSSLYTLTTASPPVAESGQVAASSQVFAAASRSDP
ncbi:unnamed protein product, partial [Closterium sp. NIES-54]